MTQSSAARLYDECLTSYTCLPALLRVRAAASPDDVALREKRLGRWRNVTWTEYERNVAIVAMGLRALGLRHGDRLAIHSENRPEWIYADLAAQGIGAIPFGIYPTNPEAEVRYLLSHSGARILVAEDQEQLDKALAVRAHCPELERLVIIDPRGTRNYDVEGLITWTELLELGQEALAERPDGFEQLVAARTVDDIASMVYTSGTTGHPKGAMLTHRNVFAIAATAVDVLDWTAADETLSYLPLCHAAEKYYSLWVPLLVGSRVNFAESIEAVNTNLVEIQPTLFLGVPRVWQKMQSTIHTRMLDSTLAKRQVYRVGLRVAAWAGRHRVERRGRSSVPVRLVTALWELLLFRSLKSKLGMARCRRALSGSAPISRDTLEFFLGIGIPISEAYGLTECVTVSFTHSDDVRLGTVGPPIDLGEVRLADDGEILVRSPLVFAGYFKDPDATRRTFDDGWLRTGDVAEWSDGHLRITDRKKDIIITAGGKNVAPSEVENALKTSPFIKEAVVVGDGRKYLAALIGLEPDLVGDWAQRRGIPYTTFADLTTKPEIQELIAAEVHKANEKLNRVEQVKQFRILPKELEEEDAEVTATQKVKRRVVEQRFADLVMDMYGANA